MRRIKLFSVALILPLFVFWATEAGWTVTGAAPPCYQLLDPISPLMPWQFCVTPDGDQIDFSAQVPPIIPPLPPPVIKYYSVFVQPARADLGTTEPRYMWVGPEPSQAVCMSDTTSIANSGSGAGSIAWGYSSALLCYPVPMPK